MLAVLCKSFGPPESLVVEEAPTPEPGAGEVRIAVEACGVNFPDTLIIEDKYQLKPSLPFAPGGEVAGRIDALGAGVSALAVGDPVIAMTGYGGFAEMLVAPVEKVSPRPETMDPITAAGFTMTYGTSMHALTQRAALQPGETLLVLGAGGGVGLAAVEIGAVMGAKVIAAASTPEKLAAAKAAGAAELIDYSEIGPSGVKDRVKALTDGRGVDVVYDPVGGDFTEQALRATGWNGRLLIVGFAAGAIPKPPANLALLKGASIVGVFWGDFRKREPEVDAANFKQLFDWFEAGRLKPVVTNAYPLEEAATALRDLSGRKAIGKIVLTTARGRAAAA